jgi:hypothetical protein
MSVVLPTCVEVAVSAVSARARRRGQVAPCLRRAVHEHDEGRRLLAAAVCDRHVQPPLLALRLASLLALGARGGGEDEGLRARAVRHEPPPAVSAVAPA